MTTQHPRRDGQGRHASPSQNLTGGHPAKIPAHNIIVVGQRFSPANKQKLVSVPDLHGMMMVVDPTPQGQSVWDDREGGNGEYLLGHGALN